MSEFFRWMRIDPRPDGFAYRFVLSVTLKGMKAERDPRGFLLETGNWCTEQYGRTDSGRWLWLHTEIEFGDERDATAFRLRWC